MSAWNRRSFLRTALGGSLALPVAAAPGHVEVEIEAAQQWINVGGRDGYLYSYNGLCPGPVIEALPGDRVRIAFRNALAEATNLHFHGLHVSPTGYADNSFLMIPPGEVLTYEFEIPANHRGGTFWYHPHVHGSVARQVSRGLAGLFLIRGELDAIPEVADADQAALVLQDFSLDSSGLPDEPGSMERMMGREGSLVTANGWLNPVLRIQGDGWLRLRLLNASSSRFHRIQIEEHPLTVIAVDGGALPSPAQLDELLLAPAERVELMVQGLRPEGNYRLLSLPYDRGGVGMGMGMGRGPRPRDPDESAPLPLVLATLAYDGRAGRSWTLPQKLSSVERLPEPSVQRTFVLGQGMGMMTGGSSFTINGRPFRADRVDTRVRLNAVEEWEFVNPTTMDHPMHVHTNPFQVVGADGQPERAWKDVVLVRAGGRARVRLAFRDFTGKSMYHCHILDHEDMGMMAVAEIAP